MATATSTGTAKTESDQRSAAQPASPAPPTTAVLAAPPATTVAATPAPKAAAAPCPARPKTAKAADKSAPGCEKVTAPDPLPDDKTASRDAHKN